MALYRLGMMNLNRTWMKPGKDFEWSNSSWTHNFFRASEMVLGRKAGVRAEATTLVSQDKDGKQYITRKFHTAEAVISFAEGCVRNAFGWRFMPFRIYIPMLATPFGPIPASPYLFSIAYDSSAASSSATNVNTTTFSHTCTGSNLALVAYWNSGRQDWTAKYNGTSMTSGLTINWFGALNKGWMSYLVAPSTGAHNVVITQTAAAAGIMALSVSLSGANQVSTLGTTGTNGNFGGSTSTTSSIALAGVASGSMIVDFLILGNPTTIDSPVTTGANQTARIVSNTNVNGWGSTSSTMSTSSPGTYTPAWSFVSETSFAQMAVEILSVPLPPSGFLAFM